MNTDIATRLCSLVSMRRCALMLGVSRTTIARKLDYLGALAEEKLRTQNLQLPLATSVEIDDQITIEHTKCKPLAVLTAVEAGSRRILGFRVARMPATGPLAAISRKKYGRRDDERPCQRRELFRELQALIAANAVIKSDQLSHYRVDLQKAFPAATHQTFKGRKARIAGQGELKEGGDDPLYAINHSLAMFRANINRLIRRTWCTTKRPDRLRKHLALYAVFHNQFLLKNSTTRRSCGPPRISCTNWWLVP